MGFFLEQFGSVNFKWDETEVLLMGLCRSCKKWICVPLPGNASRLAILCFGPVPYHLG